MGKTVAISQSNYIPWKGYFNIIRNCDEFILLDDVQFTRRDWRNRNLIKTPNDLKWLTVPVDTKGKYGMQRIQEVTLHSTNWTQEHWNLITQNYTRAPYYQEVSALLKPLYESAVNIASLSEINKLFISKICEFLEIKTKIHYSHDFFSFDELDNFNPSERLLRICQKVGANKYISGPAAKSYMDVALFAKEGIEISWAKYDTYQEYEQLYPPFTHGVSIIDMLFMLGKDSTKYFLENDSLYERT
jgi:hypothetical protein